MKKLKLFTAAIILCITCQAQVKTIVLSEKNIETLRCKHVMNINLDNQDTITYIFMGFQNSDYSSITDIRSISFHFRPGVDELDGFIKNLESSLVEMKLRSNISWIRKRYVITLYDFSIWMYLCESRKNGDGCTKINRRTVQKLIDWLKSCDF